MFVFVLFISFGMCFSKCVGVRGRELYSRGVSPDANCEGELNAVLKRENEALVKLQKCTEDNCQLQENLKQEHCTKHGYTFDSQLDMCYKVYSTPTVCRDAIKVCANDKGRLATLGSPEKASLVIDYVKKHHSSSYGIYAGGHFDQRDSVWRWEDGSKIGRLNWSPGQPNNRNECLCMIKGDSYKWHDCDHSNKNAFVCEIQ